VQFLKRISAILHRHNPVIPDLAGMEAGGKLVFVPFGGGDVRPWAFRLVGTAGAKGIGINKEWWGGNPVKTAQLRVHLERDPHKAGCSRDAYSYVAHEMAHVIHGQSSHPQELRVIVDAYRKKLKSRGVVEELGQYAWDGHGKIPSAGRYKETWAEAFSAWWSDRASCSPETISMVEQGLKALYPEVALS
jgi:hypothetical protein